MVRKKKGTLHVYLENLSQIRTKTWVQIVSYNQDFKDGNEAQRYIVPDKKIELDGGSTSIPKQWSKYFNGESSPYNKVLKVAEIHFPGSEKWFKMIFWEAITAPNYHDIDIEKLLIKVPGSEIHNIILVSKPTNNRFFVATDDIQKRIDQLKGLDQPDLLTGLILLLLKAELDREVKYKELLMTSIYEVLVNLSVCYNSKFSFLKLDTILRFRFSYKWSENDWLNDNSYSALECFKDEYFFYDMLARQMPLIVADKIGLIKSKADKMDLLESYTELIEDKKANAENIYNMDEEKLNYICIKLLITHYGNEIIDILDLRKLL